MRGRSPTRRGAHPVVRGVVALVAGCAAALAAAPASAGGGVIGTPQPELAPFHVVLSGGGSGSGAVLPNGDLVIATPITTGKAISVCLLVPGGRSCAATAMLRAFRSGAAQDTFYGSVQVIATRGDRVSIVALDCCTIGPDGAVLFNSTNGGRTWGPMTRAGDIASIGAATLAAGNIVVGSFQQQGLQVQAFSPQPSIPQTSYAVPIAACVTTPTLPECQDGDTALATYNGGVLVASDDTVTTHVEFAPSGSGLNTSASYARVATFPHELVVAASRNALLTDPNGSITGGERLRFFNGNAFGPAHRVPDSKAGDDGYFAMQKTGSTVHVFFLSRRARYTVYQETTSDGVHWSPLTPYASAVASTSLVPVLGPLGTGVLDETAGTPVNAQPVLDAQSVHVAFAPARIRAGQSSVLHGSASPPMAQTTVLQRLVGGAWLPVSSTREDVSTGAFSFTVRTPGTYRAVVNQHPGYFAYGYSSPATLSAAP